MTGRRGRGGALQNVVELNRSARRVRRESR